MAIKRYFKLSMGIEESKKGSPAYDPRAKYDYIYCCLTHNMNYVTKEANADATINKTTWGFCGYSGEAGGRLMNKPQSKGGQSTIVIDINWRYPHAHHHRHSLRTPATRPTGFSQQGPSEVYFPCKQLKTMVVGEDREVPGMSIKNLLCGKEYTVPKKMIYSKLPHLTADNHFLGKNIMNYIGESGFGITTTCHCDCFPKRLKDYCHHERVPSHDKWMRVAWFKQPVFAIKQGEKDDKKKTTVHTKTFLSS